MGLMNVIEKEPRKAVDKTISDEDKKTIENFDESIAVESAVDRYRRRRARRYGWNRAKVV